MTKHDELMIALLINLGMRTGIRNIIDQAMQLRSAADAVVYIDVDNLVHQVVCRYGSDPNFQAIYTELETKVMLGMDPK